MVRGCLAFNIGRLDRYSRHTDAGVGLWLSKFMGFLLVDRATDLELL